MFRKRKEKQALRLLSFPPIDFIPIQPGLHTRSYSSPGSAAAALIYLRWRCKKKKNDDDERAIGAGKSTTEGQNKRGGNLIFSVFLVLQKHNGPVHCSSQKKRERAKRGRWSSRRRKKGKKKRGQTAAAAAGIPGAPLGIPIRSCMYLYTHKSRATLLINAHSTPDFGQVRILQIMNSPLLSALPAKLQISALRAGL